MIGLDMDYLQLYLTVMCFTLGTSMGQLKNAGSYDPAFFVSAVCVTVYLTARRSINACKSRAACSTVVCP